MSRSGVRSRSQKVFYLSAAILLVAVLLVSTGAVVMASDAGELGGGPVLTVNKPGPSMLCSDSLQGLPDVGIATLGPAVFYDDVEAGVGEWTATGTWAITDEWCPDDDGGHSWSDSPGGDYLDNSNSTLTSGVMDLSAVGDDQNVYVRFDYKMEVPAGDYFVVEYSGNGGSTWASYESSMFGSAEGSRMLDVRDIYRTDQFRFRFRLTSDSMATSDGVHVDNIWVYATSTDDIWYTDARINYMANWHEATQYYYDPFPPATYSWQYMYTGTPDDVFQVAFTGPAVTWYGKYDEDFGIADVFVDGVFLGQADYYWDPAWGTMNDTPMEMPIARVSDLTDEAHVLTVMCSGEKNPAAKGYGISLVHVTFWGAPSTAPAAARFQQDDGDLEYTGDAWSTTSTWSASGGSFASVDAPGNALNVAFDGSYIAWCAAKGPGYGKALVSLDGGPLETVDLYRSSTSYKQRVYSEVLPDGPHTLSIYWTGDKNASAWGTSINVDAFDIIGELHEADPADPITWRYQQNDSRITYLGAWATSNTWSASGGSYSSSSQAGAAAVIEFTGTEVDLLAATGPSYGMANIYVDSALVDTVDLYSASTAWKVPVYSDYSLAGGEHTLIVECSGDKNSSSSGKTVNMDALDIAGYVSQAAAPTRVDDNDATCTSYNPAWSRWDASGYWAAYLDTYAFTDKETYRMTVAFEGTHLSWVSRTANTQGKAKVTLDGDEGTAQIIDLYSAGTSWKKRVYSTGILDDTSHYVTIECLGEKNPSSWWYTIGVDAFDIMGTPATPPPPAPLPTRYQQDDAKITYLGDWTTLSNGSASGLSYASTSQKGAVALAQFTGTEVAILASAGPSQGEVDIYLDGSFVGNVDLYSPSPAWKVSIYGDGALSPGEHTIALECTGDKNASSSGTAVNLDALDITGSLDQAATPTRIDDNDTSHATYEPAWSRWDSSGYWAAFMDTYAFTDQATYKVTVTFHGNHFSWVSRYSNTQGQAKVTLDGNDAGAVTIDLYSPSTQWKKRVYSTGVLSDDTHTVVIECLGTKNPASWWYTIGVDAFDIMETPE